MYIALISLQELLKASFQGFECVLFLSHLTYTPRTSLRKLFVMEFLWRDWWVLSGLFLCVTLRIRISRHVANSCRNVYEFAFAIRKFEAVSFISSTAAQIVDVHSSQRS